MKTPLPRRWGSHPQSGGPALTQATLDQGLQVAAADPGLSSVRAGIRVLRADIQASQDGNFAGAIEAGEEAAAVLELEGDLDGLAEALLLIGKTRFHGGDTLAAEQPLQHAAACAR